MSQTLRIKADTLRKLLATLTLLLVIGSAITSLVRLSYSGGIAPSAPTAETTQMVPEPEPAGKGELLIVIEFFGLTESELDPSALIKDAINQEISNDELNLAPARAQVIPDPVDLQDSDDLEKLSEKYDATIAVVVDKSELDLTVRVTHLPPSESVRTYFRDIYRYRGGDTLVSSPSTRRSERPDERMNKRTILS